jgi:spermidine/putrescine-binding protein
MNRRGTLNRRQWLHAAAVGTGSATAAFAGCWNASDSTMRRGKNVLKVFNWSDYLHPDVIPQFEERVGARVVYDNYSSDAELETRLATGGGAYDVVFPSDRAMPALLAKGLLKPIDRSRLPNIRHLDQKFLSPPFDPENQYSVPYFWGTMAVGIRTDKIAQAISGFGVLFDERYRGRITMLDDLENVIAAVLLHLGWPLNSVDPNHLAQAQRLLLAQKPLVQAYTSDSYKERLIAGEAWAALGWSGDLRQASQEEPLVRVVVPRSGTMIWLDSMAIPQAAQNPELAHAFIDYLLEPAIATKNAQAVQYATPNSTARDQLPAAMRGDESVYPQKETLDRCDWLRNRGADIEKVEAVWRVVRQ